MIFPPSSSWLLWLYFICGAAICGYLLLFLFSSISEKRPRAVVASLIALVVVATGWFLWPGLFSGNPAALSIPLISLAVLLVLFFAPIGRNRKMPIENNLEQVDERDVMFAREEYRPGTTRYEEYYRQRPEYQERDDRLRELPELLTPGGKYYHAERAAQVRTVFAQIKALTTQVDGKVAVRQQTVDSTVITDQIKRRTLGMGADEVGIARLDQRYVYSHVGRGPEKWGSEIVNRHRYAVVFVVEMDYYQVEQAPDLPITEEAARKYLLAAQLSTDLARYIRSLGYPARAHISDSNYQIMLPPVAREAGLGELGRIGYLISPRLGARLRLGAVTTDLPLSVDHPRSFGLQEFCDRCLKCATNCPSAAIPRGDVTMVRGVGKWPLKVEQCLRYWRLAGTDCGICMKVCPYSHPPTLVHNLVRLGIRRSAFARTVSVWADDLFYGRKVRYPQL